jgi:lipoprotein-anchoring transpeptidase ErfK/SrfK
VKRFVLFVALALVVCGAAAPSAQRTAVVRPGVVIGGVEVGGLSSEKARAAIAWWYSRPLRLVFLGKHWNVRPSVLGARVDTDLAVQRVLKAQPGERLDLHARIDAARLERYIRVVNSRLTVPPQNATVTLAGVEPVIERGKLGVQIDRASTLRRIEAALAVGRRSPVVRVTSKSIVPSVTSSNFGAVIVIQRASNELHLYDGAQPWQTFPVATGQSIYPTPLGSWHIVDMQRNPWWRPPDSTWAQGLKPIPPGPGNPLGTRWMGLDAAGVGMHGTPDAASIGYSASHGCIRMRIPDAEWLFDHVNIGTPVFIVDA